MTNQPEIKAIVYFTTERIDPNNVKGMYVYPIRHVDGDSFKPYSVEKNVFINYYGSIITNKPLDQEFDYTNFIKLNKKTVSEFKQSHSNLVINFDDNTAWSFYRCSCGEIYSSNFPYNDVRCLQCGEVIIKNN
jgi:DNA-directed RNA polymerase subunit RPC12/RpoP